MSTIRNRFHLIAILAALVLPGLTAPAVIFTSDTTIGFSNTNYEGQDIVVFGCKLTVDGAHSFSDVLLVDNGILTHSFSTNAQLSSPTNNFLDPLTLTGTNAVTLSASNVLTATIVITSTNSIVYTNGADYVVSSSGAFTKIARTANSFIPDGAAISASYQAQNQPVNTGLYLNVSNNIVIESGSVIRVDGGGFGGGFGPGTGGSIVSQDPYDDGLFYFSGGGGGYGGLGGESLGGAAGGASYGSINNPINAGSGGGTGASTGGAGGGVVDLVVGGTILVDGQITAGGSPGVNSGSGGGSGGSILLNCQFIAGGGTLSANGGAGEPFAGGGGAGGRISVITTSNEFTGTMTAQGGQGGASTGAAGTVYTISKNLGNIVSGQVVVDNGGASGTNTPLSTTLPFDLTVSGGGVTSFSTITHLGSLTIGSNSWVTTPSNGVGSLNLLLSGNATIAAGGGIIVDGLGSPAGQGTGAGISFFSNNISIGSGGSYGGYGNGITNPSFLENYGSITAPAQSGSGGAPSTFGGAGGGLITLSIAGTLQLGGTISANGTTGIGESSGGGSGGGLYITAGKLAGGGNFSANGGAGQSVLGGGGGGGRIAVYSGTNQFTGTVTAYGGAGAGIGGAGTIYLQLTNGVTPALVVDNGGQSGNRTPLGILTGTFDLLITNGAVLMPTGPSLTIHNLLISPNSFLVETGATAQFLQITITGNATIQSGGGILLDGLGYTSISGPGNGSTATGINGITSGGGGGHGGYGGISASGALGGNTYDSITSPNSAGSAGGLGAGLSPFNVGGNGGGAIHLTVTGAMQLFGFISANGLPGVGQGAGGGAGGTIFLTLNSLFGGGTISANGGAGESVLGGGGGGGRIAVTYNTTSFTGTMSTAGGAGFTAGGAGTVYNKLNQSSYGLVILDNGGVQATNTVLNGLTSMDVIITNGATVSSTGNLSGIRNLVIASNSFLTVTSQFALSLTFTGNVSILPGGAIILDGKGIPGGTFGQGSGGSIQQTGTILMGGGGGYGGVGGSSASGVGGGTYFGLITAPANLGGSGGNGSGSSSNGYGGSGGGAVHLTVSSNLFVGGVISANGAAGIGEASGGGAGGSIWLNAGTLSGNGLISANGGAGEPTLGGGGGGGGGRIAIFTTVTNQFQGAVTAYGGPGGVAGGAGTVWLQTTSSVIAQFVIDNGGLRGANTFFSPTGDFDLTVANGAICVPLANVSGVRNLLVNSNALMTLAPPSNGVTFLEVVATGNVTIQSNGAINVDALNSQSPGSDPGQSSSSNGVISGGGGGYGGYGGSSSRGVIGGAPFGTLSTPTASGSSGGAGGGTSPFTRGGYGGTAIEISASSNIVVNGSISANGGSGIGQSSGGGSGGSIYLTAASLTGTGTLTANGGAGEPSLGGGGGGSGGRIGFSLRTNLFAGTVSAHGGTGGMAGGAGTIYTSILTNNVSLLLLDNGGLRGSNTLLSTGTSTYDLIVSNGASAVAPANFIINNLTICSNSILTAIPSPGAPLNSVILTARSNATILPGGGVAVDGLGYSGTVLGPSAGASITVNNSVTGGGGGYGGNGGTSAGGAAGGVASGSISSPETFGSNGGRGNGSSPFSVGGAGGGAVQLNINGTLQVAGVITANGLTGIGEGSGGGAGGSIYLTVGKLTGSGVIAANGGAGESSLGGGGGGGRIAIYLGKGSSNQFTGTITAFGGPGFAAGGAGTIFNSSTDNNTPQILVDNGAAGTNTSTALPSFGFADLTLTNGARVTLGTGGQTIHNLLMNPNTTIFYGTNASTPLTLNISGNATVMSGAQIIADGGGSTGGQGLGAGTVGFASNSVFSATGGSYGGNGGSAKSGARGGTVYGSILQPISFGSGGGSMTSPASQAAGGGVIRMIVTGTLSLNGAISANGATPASQGNGGGSGGSAWLTVGTLTGAGSISANGGSGNLPNDGGGGGGRIAIYYTSNLFTGAISAHGGTGFLTGGAGTIYTRSNQSIGSLLVDNGGLHGTNTPLTAPEAFNLTVSGNAIAQGPSTIDPTLVLGSLLVQSNGTITTLAASDNLSLVVLGNATVTSNASISVDAKGYNGSGAAGPLVGPGAGTMATNGSGSGAGYGGAGGASASHAPGGTTYGSSTQPTDWGSLGGLPLTGASLLSQGGGAIRMEVGGALTVNGSVSANGANGIFPQSGGGSGGSVWLSANLLVGAGKITANGGAGEPTTGGGGGGGRIALYYVTDNFTGTTTALGATGASPGQNGTLFLTNLPTPQFTGQVPTGIVNTPVTSISVSFNSLLSPASLPSITLITPNGPYVPPINSYSISNNYPQDVSQLVLTLPQPMTDVGTYTLQINPPVQDIFGLSSTAAYIGSFVISKPFILGTIIDTNGTPIPSVTVKPSGNAPVLTDGIGNFIVSVPLNWTGTLTPSLGDLVFFPGSLSYTNLTTSITNQNFLAATPDAFALQSVLQGTNLTLGWFGLNGVSYQIQYSSNMTTWLPYGSPIIGTNGMLNLALPVDGSPQRYYRFGAAH